MAEEKKDDVVGTAKERYERAKGAYSSSRALAIEDTKFALGDSDNGWQWPEQIRQTRTAERKVCLTVNMTAQHCNQIINNIRQNRPQCRVLPVDNGADKKTAEIMAGLIRNIQTSSNADDAHDTAAEHSIYGGEGYWRVLTEYESPKSFKQRIRIAAIPNPLMVYIDPAARELDKSDADWGFLFEDISKEQCKREHKGIDPASWSEEPKGWVTADTIRRAEYFHAEYQTDTAYLINDGSEEGLEVLKSDMKPGELKAYQDGGAILDERATISKKWKWCKILGGHDAPLDEKDWPGAYLPIISIVGKEVNVNGEIVRKGIVRDLKDPARMVNFSYSEAIRTVALQNKIPYIAAAEAVEGYEEQWKNANVSDCSYLPFNAFDDAGNAIPPPQRQEPAVMPAAQIQMLQLSTEQMRAASGQQNANFGIKSEAASGVGIRRLKEQGEVATFHFPDNLVRGLRYEAKILLDLIPKVYDTKRVVRILGIDGKDEQATLDPEAQQAYSENITAEDVQKIFNPTLGMYDVVIDTGPTYQTQRQEAQVVMTEVAAKDPNFMGIAGDIFWRAQDVPMSDQLAKRYEKVIPPELQDQKGQKPIPPEVQQKLQQSEQMIQQLDQTVQAMTAELESKQIEAQKVEIDRMNAETNRMKAEGELQIKAAALNQPEAPQQEPAMSEIDKLRIDAELKIQLKQMDIDAAREIEIMRLGAKQAESQAAAQTQAQEKAMETTQDEQPDQVLQSIEMLAQGLQTLADGQQAIVDGQAQLAQLISAPRKRTLVRDPETGRALHATDELSTEMEQQ
jgi:hypothetical protein